MLFVVTDFILGFSLTDFVMAPSEENMFVAPQLGFTLARSMAVALSFAKNES